VYGKDVYGVLLTPDMRVKITKLSQRSDFSVAASPVYDAPLADFLADDATFTAMTTEDSLEASFLGVENLITSSGINIDDKDLNRLATSVPVTIELVNNDNTLPVYKYTFNRSQIKEGGLFHLDSLASISIMPTPMPIVLRPLTPTPQQHYRPLLDERPSVKPDNVPADEWEFDKRRMYPQPTAVLSTTAGRVYVGVEYKNGGAVLKWQAPKNGVRYES